jgi:hypothetical protein
LKSLVSLVILSLSKDVEGDYEAGFGRLNLTVRFNEDCIFQTETLFRVKPGGFAAY